MVALIILFGLIYYLEKYTNTFGPAHKVFWRTADFINALVEALRKYANQQYSIIHPAPAATPDRKRCGAFLYYKRLLRAPVSALHSNGSGRGKAAKNGH